MSSFFASYSQMLWEPRSQYHAWGWNRTLLPFCTSWSMYIFPAQWSHRFLQSTWISRVGFKVASREFARRVRWHKVYFDSAMPREPAPLVKDMVFCNSDRLLGNSAISSRSSSMESQMLLIDRRRVCCKFCMICCHWPFSVAQCSNDILKQSKSLYLHIAVGYSQSLQTLWLTSSILTYSCKHSKWNPRLGLQHAGIRGAWYQSRRCRGFDSLTPTCYLMNCLAIGAFARYSFSKIHYYYN